MLTKIPVTNRLNNLAEKTLTYALLVWAGLGIADHISDGYKFRKAKDLKDYSSDVPAIDLADNKPKDNVINLREAYGYALARIDNGDKKLDKSELDEIKKIEQELLRPRPGALDHVPWNIQKSIKSFEELRRIEGVVS